MKPNPKTPEEKLQIIRAVLRAIEAEPEPTSSMLELRRLLAERAEMLEAIQRLVTT